MASHLDEVQAQLDAATDDATQLKQQLREKTAEVGALAAQLSAMDADGVGDEHAVAQQQQVQELESELAQAVATARSAEASAEAAHVAQLKLLRDELVAGRAEVEATHSEAKAELATQLEEATAKLAQSATQKESLTHELAAATASSSESAQHAKSALSKQKRVLTKRSEKQVTVIKTWAKERCGALTQTIAEAHADLGRERSKLAAEHAKKEAVEEDLANSKAEAQHTLRHIESVSCEPRSASLHAHSTLSLAALRPPIGMAIGVAHPPSPRNFALSRMLPVSW